MSFLAMGTEVSVHAPAATEDAERALEAHIAELFEREEQRFSRFRPDSELSQLHESRGSLSVSPELFDALWSARRHFDATAGLFDPAVGAALAALGYDRSFEPGALDREQAGPRPRSASYGEVRLDPGSRTVARPAHVSIDLGGLVKGRTVDAAARLLPSLGAVEAGGDAALRGSGADGRGWQVDVEDPFDPSRVLVTLRLSDRAVATSAPNRRRWRVGDRTAHHLIDPRTGEPAGSDLAQVTVVAASAELAEVLCKPLFLLGHEGARAALEAMDDVAAVLVTQAGEVTLMGDLELDDEAHGGAR